MLLAYYLKTSKYIKQQIELGIECSVKDNISVKEAIVSAQNIVLYPLKVLMNKESKMLQPNFLKAITRIFRIMDSDSDGWLSDKNLVDLQHRVFNMDMSPNELKAMKEIISDELNDNSTRYGISLAAFQIIFRKLLDMIKIKNCWVF